MAQLLAEGAQPLPKTRAEEAVVAHFDKAFGQHVLRGNEQVQGAVGLTLLYMFLKY
jgi:hypothetical protein